MSDQKEHQPGARAPTTANYEELNVFGSPTGAIVHVHEGDPLPAAPRSFTWRRKRKDFSLSSVSGARPTKKPRVGSGFLGEGVGDQSDWLAIIAIKAASVIVCGQKETPREFGDRRGVRL